MSLLFPSVLLTFRRMKVLKRGYSYFFITSALILLIFFLALSVSGSQLSSLNFSKFQLVGNRIYLLSGVHINGGWVLAVKQYKAQTWNPLGRIPIDTIAVDFVHHQYYNVQPFGIVEGENHVPYIYYREFNGKPTSPARVKRYKGCDWEDIGASSLDEAVSFMHMCATPKGVLYLSYLKWQGNGYVPIAKQYVDGSWLNLGQLPMEGYYGSISISNGGKPCYQYTCGNVVKRTEFIDCRWVEVECVEIESL